MTIDKTVRIKLTEDELVRLVATEFIDLRSWETWALSEQYTYSGEYVFKIVDKKDEGYNSEEH